MEDKIPLDPTKVETNTGALEGLLDDLRGIVWFLATLIALVGGISTYTLLGSIGKPIILPIGIFVLEVAVSAFLINLLLKIIAEFLRLQKHKAGLPYSGEISTPDITTTYTCPICKSPATGSPCTSCKQPLLNPNKS